MEQKKICVKCNQTLNLEGDKVLEIGQILPDDPWQRKIKAYGCDAEGCYDYWCESSGRKWTYIFKGEKI
tara:strand:- start:2572 stop:2778 length:207 start_codon:yes stop_codon:yes gene_type:complete